MMKEKNAVIRLTGFLNHKDMSIRQATAWCLGEIGDARAVASLSDALGDKKTDVRLNAAWALGKIGDPGAVETLTATVQNDKEKIPVRQNAAWALGRITENKAVPTLIGALSDYDVGNVAYWSLKQITGEDFGIGTTEAIEAWERWCGEPTE